MRLRFGYGFESCDANSPRNVKNTNLAKHRPAFIPPLLLVGSKESVLRVPKRGQISSCDSCDNLTLRFVWPRSTTERDSIAAKLLRCGIASEALRRNMPLRFSFFFAELSPCAPLCCKSLCCASRFCTGGGELSAVDPSKCRGNVQQMLVRGHNLRLLAEVGSLAPAAQGPANQDSQHMLKQPRGSFPDIGLNFCVIISAARVISYCKQEAPIVLTGLAFVVLRFESRDWRSLV